MKKSKFSEEQIAYVLLQVEGGSPVADVCRQIGVSEATFCGDRCQTRTPKNRPAA